MITNNYKLAHSWNILIKLSYLKLVLIFYLVILLFIAIPFEILDYIFDIESGNNPFLNDFGFFKLLLMVVIVGLVFETFVFQVIPLKIMNFVLPSFPVIAIIILSLLFASNHPFSVAYIIYTFFMGLVFALLVLYS